MNGTVSLDNGKRSTERERRHVQPNKETADPWYPSNAGYCKGQHSVELGQRDGTRRSQCADQMTPGIPQTFNDVDAQTESSGIEQSEEEYARIRDYDDWVANYSAQLKSQVNVLTRGRTQSATVVRAATVKVKLPRLELSKFHVKQRDWQSFWE